LGLMFAGFGELYFLLGGLCQAMRCAGSLLAIPAIDSAPGPVRKRGHWSGCRHKPRTCNHYVPYPGDTHLCSIWIYHSAAHGRASMASECCNMIWAAGFKPSKNYGLSLPFFFVFFPSLVSMQCMWLSSDVFVPQVICSLLLSAMVIIMHTQGRVTQTARPLYACCTFATKHVSLQRRFFCFPCCHQMVENTEGEYDGVYSSCARDSFKIF
jgi:hypothetical protein